MVQHNSSFDKRIYIIILTVLLLMAFMKSAYAEPNSKLFNTPWKNKQQAIVIDAYERNHIDWETLVKNKQIRAFIGKASDGMPSPYSCPGNSTEKMICKKSFQNYFMKQQLYHTRRTLAKNLGLKWGAYHLSRPGNPVAQANHFLNFAKPTPDDLIALDIEHDDPSKWISFEDAEIFAKHIYTRIGRYPVLYTNHDTAKKIAARRAEFPILSRLPLWYARYRSNIRGVFPMGNWENYNLWQFSAGINCNKRRCLYRVAGAPNNIDVNVSNFTIAEFEKAWPFDGLVPAKPFDEVDEVDEEMLIASTDKITLASIQDNSAVLTVHKNAKPLTKAEMKELGFAKLVIPQPAPRAVSQAFDRVNLVVNIIRRDKPKDYAQNTAFEPYDFGGISN